MRPTPKPQGTRVLRAGDTGREVAHLRRYLGQFGYATSCDCRTEVMCPHLADGLERYQVFFGLPVTRELDAATLAQMRKPRCGVPDLKPGDDVRRLVDDYRLSGGRWDHENVTYFFQGGTDDIGGTAEQDIVRRAFDAWAFVTPLSFTQVTDESAADIRIQWPVGDHGDGSPFDGFGNVLAHAFFPPPVNAQPIAGDVHFDDAESWDTEDGGWWFWRRIDLLSVAVHEIGHALGLMHSTVEGAVMWPSYEGERRVLSQDDIDGIQAIYGPPRVPAGGTFAEASLWALRNTGGYGTVTIDLGRPRRFLAWGSPTMVDALSDFDRDNAVAIEVYQVDGIETWRAVYGGDHWGGAGGSSNVHQGAFVGVGQRVTFRLRSLHPEDLDVYGVGKVVALDD